MRHRPELRHLMLPGLFANPRKGEDDSAVERKRALREATLATCCAAADFYDLGPPEDDPARAFREDPTTKGEPRRSVIGPWPAKLPRVTCPISCRRKCAGILALMCKPCRRHGAA